MEEIMKQLLTSMAEMKTAMEFNKVANPFFYNMENFHNTWVDDYMVSIQGLTETVNGEESELDSDSNAINNRISTDVAAFSNRGFL